MCSSSCTDIRGKNRGLSSVGGTNIIFSNSTLGNRFWVSHTLDRKNALGGEITRLPAVDLGTVGGHYALLMQRWNEKLSQGNAYFHLSSGGAFGLQEGILRRHSSNQSVDNRTFGYLNTGFAFDWETRFIYVYYSWEGLFLEEIGQRLAQNFRFGFSPVERNYEEMQFWIIFEIRNRVYSGSVATNAPNIQQFRKELTVFTPYFRFFQRKIFFEIGYSDQQTLLFNILFRI